MTHRPVSVLRNDSMTAHSRLQSRVGFSLPRQQRKIEPEYITQVECGSGIIPKACLSCCCPPERCNHAKLASPQVFVGVLIALLILHGATEGYLAEILPTIIIRFHLPVVIVDWILVGHRLSQVLVGIFVAYSANRNRPKRLGGYIALFAVACLSIITTHLVHGDISVSPSAAVKGPQLCLPSKMSFGFRYGFSEETCWTMLALLIIFQFFAGASSVALMSHGITYMDDNIGKVNSPAYLGAAFGVGYVGRKLGSVLGWTCLEIPLSEDTPSTTSFLGSWWLGWPYLSATLLIGALVISLFPNQMPSTAVKYAAKRILSRLREEEARSSAIGESDLYDENTGDQSSDKLLLDTSLWATLRRVITNKMIIASLLASIFLEAAIGNFLALEPVYLESVYQIPKQGTLQRHGMQMDGFQDPWMSRLITGMLKAPLIAMTLIVSGLLISRIKPKASSLAGWTAAMAFFASIITGLFLLMICPSKIHGEINGRLDLEDMCNVDCHCNGIGAKSVLQAEFTPICSQDGTETFFSPCHAGCKTSSIIHNMQVFGNCSCTSGLKSNDARLGGCVSGNSTQCRFGWIFFQGSLALIQILIASGVIGKLLLCLRCVLPQDKPMVFGLEMTVISFFAYVPFKILYYYLKEMNCISRTASGVCQMHESKKLALSVNIVTSLLLFVSGLLTIWVAIIARDLDLFTTDDEEESYEISGLDEIDDSERSTLRESRYGTPWPVRKKRGKKTNSNELSQQSGLLQMIVTPAAPSKATPVDETPPDTMPLDQTNTTTEL